MEQLKVVQETSICVLDSKIHILQIRGLLIVVVILLMQLPPTGAIEALLSCFMLLGQEFNVDVVGRLEQSMHMCFGSEHLV